jgi:hypothetical protein
MSWCVLCFHCDERVLFVMLEVRGYVQKGSVSRRMREGADANAVWHAVTAGGASEVQRELERVLILESTERHNEQMKVRAWAVLCTCMCG